MWMLVAANTLIRTSHVCRLLDRQHRSRPPLLARSLPVSWTMAIHPSCRARQRVTFLILSMLRRRWAHATLASRSVTIGRAWHVILAGFSADPCFSLPSSFDAFQVALHEARMALGVDASGVSRTRLVEAINSSALNPFTVREVQQAIVRMEDDNRIMVADDMIFFI